MRALLCTCSDETGDLAIPARADRDREVLLVRAARLELNAPRSARSREFPLEPNPGGKAVSEFLSDEELKRLDPAETHAFESPVPTQPISNGEFFPGHQSKEQKQVEALIKDSADAMGRKLGMERRRFLKTAAGMATAFLAMNKVYGKVFEVDPSEAAIPELAADRARKYSDEFVCDIHTHFLRDDTRLTLFVKVREWTGRN